MSLFSLQDARPDSIRRQETGLILLNVTVLAGIALVHVLFAPRFGTPPRLFFLVLMGRILLQTIELIVVQSDREIVRRSLPTYAHASIWINLLFALLLSRLADFQDSHYVVLMVIPIVAAAFRYPLAGVAFVVLSAASATFLEVWLYRREHPEVGMTEYLEAASMALMYVVVALVVSMLARQLRAEQRAVERSLIELERTRDRLVEEKKLAAVGRLASAIAHEIRNPVGLIVSSLALSRQGGEGSLTREELDGILQTESARLERLTTDFLTYARSKPPQKQRTDVGTALAYIADLGKARAAGTGVLVRVDAPPALTADLDEFQTQQALLNLLVNALDVSPSGSTVVLGARRDGGGEAAVTLFVENAGPPISADLRERVFEPFFTTKRSGSGLGLAIARRIAQEHGGDLTLEVNEPGCVRFAFTVPDLPAEAPDVVEDALAAPADR